jgi:hypothetical protein
MSGVSHIFLVPLSRAASVSGKVYKSIGNTNKKSKQMPVEEGHQPKWEKQAY